MPDLLAPTMRLHSAWRAAHEEWGPGTHEDGFGLLPEDDVSSSAGFAAWLSRLLEESNQATQLGDGRVNCTYRWITEDDQVLGGIALRHELDDLLMAEGGHIGGTSDLRGVYPQKIPVGSASISASSSAMLPGSMKS